MAGETPFFFLVKKKIIRAIIIMRRVAGIVIQSRVFGFSSGGSSELGNIVNCVVFSCSVKLDVSFIISGAVVFCLICKVNISLLSENSS